MRGIFPFLVLMAGVASNARAMDVRMATESPLSADRLRDALRTYVDGAVVSVDELACQKTLPPPEAEKVFLCLGKDPATETTVLVYVDAEETVIARFAASTRTEDLYRAAALKVQSVLSRRRGAALSAPTMLAGPANGGLETRPSPSVVLEWGAGLFVPRLRPSQGALKFGLAVPRGPFSLGAGVYLLASQRLAFQGVDIERREVPLYAAGSYFLGTGRLRPEVGLFFHGTFLRASAMAADGTRLSHTGFSPRVGGSAGVLLSLSTWYAASIRLSGMWALTDERYLVDGYTAISEGGATLLMEIGLFSPGL